jgi:hypothetical protein
MTQVTAERAAMLAAHAIHVQGGFSTPAIEKARAEAQLAQSPGSIDWDKMQAEVVAAITADQQSDEVAAAEAEGLLPMPTDLVPLRDEKLALDKAIEELNGRLKEIKDTFGKRLTDDGAQAYLLNGKVHARRSPGTRHSVDSKKLKAERPDYLKTTQYVSINIT